MGMHSSKAIFRWTLASSALAMLAFTLGCRQDMQHQPKMIPQRGTRFFANGRSARPQVQGTVSRGQEDEADYFHTGFIDGQVQDKLPFPATMTVLLRGQEQFNLYCTPCHSRVGNGRGMIVERGYKPAGDLVEPRIMQEPLGHYFDVITHGYGAMPDYAAQINTQDRWAIAAYIRALQLSQHGTLQDVPAGQNIQTVAEVSQQLGYPADFVQQWKLPELTNVPSAGDMKPTLVGNPAAQTPGAAGRTNAAAIRTTPKGTK